jgi:endonuclease YncB( thermonuclease family)
VFAVRSWVVCLALILLFLPAACRKKPKGTVVGVADGDTVTVLEDEQTERKVRLNGIDAPERGQPFGETAKQHLSELVFGKVVSVQGKETDRYGRLVGVLILDGKDINLEQLKAGQAWYYRQYESDVEPARRSVYAAAEAEARQARRGLWRDAAPEAPWEFRARQRGEQEPNPTAKPASPTPGSSTAGRLIGNRNSRVYHAPGCPGYDKVSEHNRVYFETEQAALAAGFRRAGNCR